MRRFALGLLTFIGLGQAGLAVAQADDESFLTFLENPDIAAVEFNQPSDWLLDMGYDVCGWTLEGKPQLRIIKDVRYNGKFNLDAVQAVTLVRAAQNEICPWAIE